MPIRPTESVLLDVCAGDPSAVHAANWLDVIQLAAIHEVQPVAASIIRRGPQVAALGDHANTMLDAIHAQSVIQFRLAAEELSRVLDGLPGVPAMVLKGPVLAAAYYGNGERTSQDIDLYVDEPDYKVARDRLTAMGYRVMEPYDESAQLGIGKDVAFSRTDDFGRSWSVELHWRFAEPGFPAIDPLSVWEKARHVNVGDHGATSSKQLLTPGPEHTLLLLALNLRKHKFARLKTLIDIDRLIAVDGGHMDWEFVHKQAHSAGMCRTVRRSLELARELLSPVSSRLGAGTANSAGARTAISCNRTRGMRMSALRRLTSAELALAMGREPGDFAAFSGVLPFASLDKSTTTLHLIWRRLTMSPSLASYRTGDRVRYRSRSKYAVATTGRIFRLLAASPRLLRPQGTNVGSAAEVEKITPQATSHSPLVQTVLQQ